MADNPYRSRIIDGRVKDARSARLRKVHYGMDGKIIEGEDQMTGADVTVPQRPGDPLVPKMGRGMGWLKRNAERKVQMAEAQKEAPKVMPQAAAMAAGMAMPMLAPAMAMAGRGGQSPTPAQPDVTTPQTTPSRAALMTAKSGQATPITPATTPAKDPFTAVKQRVASAQARPVAAAPQASSNTTVTPLPNGGYRTSAKLDPRNNAADGITPYGLIGKAAEVANRATANAPAAQGYLDRLKGTASNTVTTPLPGQRVRTSAVPPPAGSVVVAEGMGKPVVTRQPDTNFADANDPEAYRRRMRGGMPKMPAVTPQGRRMDFSTAF